VRDSAHERECDATHANDGKPLFADTPPATPTISMSHGLLYVYTGNVHGGAGSSTYCHHCGAPLIGCGRYELPVGDSAWKTDAPGAGAAQVCSRRRPAREEQAASGAVSIRPSAHRDIACHGGH
jgi:hypothetical protein